MMSDVGKDIRPESYAALLAIFNPRENVCSGVNVYENGVHPLEVVDETDSFISLNPLDPNKTRADANVTCFRNILLEFDEGTKEEQYKIFKDIPFTLATWSGGKSYHIIISLVEPCQNRDAYDALVRRVYNRVPGIDRSCKNPSRLTRIPGAKREGGPIQSILQVNNRISNARLEAWLGPDVAELDNMAGNIITYTAKPLHRILRADTWYFLSEGAPKGEWNRQLFLACIDMCRAGFPNEEIMQRCLDVTGKLTASDKRTIASAIKIVKAEK